MIRFWFHFRLLLMMGPLGLAAFGCDTQPEAQSAAERTRVVTSVYALADVVRQVGGSRVNVTWFVESGQSLERLEPTSEQSNQVRNADLIIARGAAEPWMLAGTGDSFRDRRVIRLDRMPSARDAEPTLYLWLDPQVTGELVEELALRLAVLDPRGEAEFKANAAKLTRQISSLTQAARDALAPVRGAPFLSMDRGFLPLARRFQLTEVRAPKSLTISDPSSYAAKALHEAARSAGARVIFANCETPPAVLRDWESRIALPLLPLDALGSSAPAGRSTYVEILSYNLDQLEAGVTGGVKAAPTTATTDAPAAPR